ncbi:Lrp/AsnC family transcriptional regulator [Marinomonas atlantica]|uniref:Lrp/AsnC family transcriptional regulator n=1 Tax=Marinomonas atlantica TaxID=1806668 RepID=UPI0008320BFA|nr:Lrp/AsnC family transcriptional regulator [Marinomonas atlantica]
MPELDNIDRNILRQLQVDSRLTNVQLAEVIGLSPPACLKRVKRLTEDGYIARQVTLLEPSKLGPMLHMVVEVFMERDHKHLFQAFVQRVQNTPEVKQCYQVTGEVDFVLIVMTSDMVAYESLCDRLLYSDPNVRKFRTLISMKRDKFETAIDIP